MVFQQPLHKRIASRLVLYSALTLYLWLASHAQDRLQAQQSLRTQAEFQAIAP